MYLLYCTRTFRLMFGPLKYIGRAALGKKKETLYGYKYKEREYMIRRKINLKRYSAGKSRGKQGRVGNEKTREGHRTGI